MPSNSAHAIAGYYDGIFRFYGTGNALLTLGLDGRWRRQAAKTLRALRPGAASALDVCTGTGECAAALRRAYGGALRVTGTDFSGAMLSLARQRAGVAEFIEAPAENLPFGDASFDVVSISFAARNLNSSRARLLAALRECRRVLKAGGVLMNLETTRPANPVINLFFRLYTRAAINLINLLRPASRAAYSFLKHTILGFYGADEFSALLLEAGFKTADYKTLWPGAVAVHTAVK